MSFSAKQNKPDFHLNIGSASILMIFVILCLVSFATLSIVSASADSRLSAKVSERTASYYEACNQAELLLADFDSSLADAYASCHSAEEYFSVTGHKKSYSVPVNELQTLQVSLEIRYPAKPGEPYYQISAWQVLTKEPETKERSQ